MFKKNIVYASEHGERGRLDLHLPDNATNCPLVMVIHGGGLQALSKERMDGVAAFIAEQGWAAVNVNYRLLPDHPFPAQVQDVLRAYRWIQETDQEDIVRQDRTRVALLGASAGGFLAMMAGLLLGIAQVRAIVSISGPSLHGGPCLRDLSIAKLSAVKGLDPQMFSPPTELVSSDAPPLLATHSRNDTVVAVEHAIAIVQRMKAAGGHAELYLYDGLNELHGIWRDDRAPLRLFPHIEDVIAAFLRTML